MIQFISDDLLLDERDVSALIGVFHSIDTYHTGVISSKAFFQYYNIPITSFNERMFEMGNVDGIKVLTPCRFICSMWSFLTLDVKELGSYIFILYDEENTKLLDASQIRAMLKCIHDNSETDSDANSLVGALLRDSDMVPLCVFAKWCRECPSLYRPVQILQATLRRQVCGNDFWETLCCRRNSRRDLAEATYMWKLNSKYAEEIFKRQLASRMDEMNKHNSGEISATSRSCTVSLSARCEQMYSQYEFTDDGYAEVETPTGNLVEACADLILRLKPIAHSTASSASSIVVSSDCSNLSTPTGYTSPGGCYKTPSGIYVGDMMEDSHSDDSSKPEDENGNLPTGISGVVNFDSEVQSNSSCFTPKLEGKRSIRFVRSLSL
eukprot:CAMPEP_0185037238 /NCGR_PEP_ID=MMETSP1103-20130426/31366_1 /TAXON_ID=36769 /ORGANISM="Paraphysomonas bandaiensis, Strain Caron Lab Isolate" /LENGTH=379 /DNA_ID=CAMNT_0027575125 /DNA_START=220 /DNA_END=1359 /DNA_ORIENTATION=-